MDLNGAFLRHSRDRGWGNPNNQDNEFEILVQDKMYMSYRGGGFHIQKLEKELLLMRDPIIHCIMLFLFHKLDLLPRKCTEF